MKIRWDISKGYPDIKKKKKNICPDRMMTMQNGVAAVWGRGGTLGLNAG